MRKNGHGVIFLKDASIVDVVFLKGKDFIKIDAQLCLFIHYIKFMAIKSSQIE